MAQPIIAFPGKKHGVATEIEERLSQELIFALVGPVGSGVSTAAKYLEKALKSDYLYDLCPIIKVSDLIRSQSHLVSMLAPGDYSSSTYISSMQDIGNKLREVYGNHYLIEKAIEKIRVFREGAGGYDGDVELPGRRAYIIDSVKNRDELALLRAIYGETLCVVGVFAPDQLRNKRLENLGFPALERQEIMDRDQGEIMSFGQETRKIFVDSDFFICNDAREEDVRLSVERFLELVFDVSVRTPTLHESAMYHAESASAKSACMSRQVGASIYSESGELIAVGWNDVPRFGGGLYSEQDRYYYDVASAKIENRDARCHNWLGGKCHNDDNRARIMDQVTKSAGKVVSADSETETKIRDVIGKSDIGALIEFSRSIHAEMEAILSVAREGKHSLVGATLYTNTYPCHNCARHIVAAGIKKVVYIKPYKKSLALKLHKDAISEVPSDEDKVVFSQFDGIAPKNYLRLFMPKSERKSEGKLSRVNKGEAIPVFRAPLDGQRAYEDKVIADLAQKEQK